MIGSIDQRGRALRDVRISRKVNGGYIAVTTWIDTAFDGHLVLPLELIKELELDSLAQTEAILADGARVTLEAFFCYVDCLVSDDQFRSLQMMEGFRSLELGFLRSKYCISTIREKQSRWIELPNAPVQGGRGKDDTRSRTAKRVLPWNGLFAFAILQLDHFRMNRTAGIRVRRRRSHGKFAGLVLEWRAAGRQPTESRPSNQA